MSFFMKFCRFFDSVRTTRSANVPHSSRVDVNPLCIMPSRASHGKMISFVARKRKPRENTRREVYSAVTARAIERGYQYGRFVERILERNAL